MNTAPVHHHDNPDSELQRPGFCIVDNRDLFLCDDVNSPHGMAMGRGGGWKFGYCRASEKPRVWLSLVAAVEMAAKVNGKVTTVPRRVGWANGGPVLTWSEVKE